MPRALFFVSHEPPHRGIGSLTLHQDLTIANGSRLDLAVLQVIEASGPNNLPLLGSLGDVLGHDVVLVGVSDLCEGEGLLLCLELAMEMRPRRAKAGSKSLYSGMRRLQVDRYLGS